MRIYQPFPLKIGEILRLDERGGHHLARVLRANVGDPVTLFNGEGGEFEALIVKIDKKGVDVEVVRHDPREVESPIDIILAQGLARGEKMDFIVQKAVELGVKKIIPLVTERCNVRLENEREIKRIEHWRAVIISACEQCGRNRLPSISSPISLAKWLEEEKIDHGFVLSPHVSERLSGEFKAGAKVALVIGPEGGLSETEVKLANSKGFLSLNLGPRVLRTETAPLAAITILQSFYGDMVV